MDEQELADLQALHAHLRMAGLRTEWMDGPAVRQLEPCLNPEIQGGMVLEGVVQMDAQRCVNALEKIVRSRGGQLVVGTMSL